MMRQRVYALVCAGVLLCGLAGCSQAAGDDAPIPESVVSAASEPADTPTPTASTAEVIAQSLCEASVKDDTHLDPSILTFTDVVVNYDEGDKDIAPFYSVSGYVNSVEFGCVGIRVDDYGIWDQHSFDVTIAGIDTEESGEY